MQESCSCSLMMSILSTCQIGALLLSGDNRILEINEAGRQLLHIEITPAGLRLTDRRLPACVQELCKKADIGPEDAMIYVAFGEYIRRHPVPEPADLPEGSRLVGFRSVNQEYRAEIMNAVLNKITEGVVTCDSEERLTFYNEAAEKVDSVVLDSVRGKKVSDVYTMTDGSDVMLPKVMKQRSPSLNYRQKYTTSDGKHHDVVANAFPIIVNGQMLGAVNVVEDWSRMDDLHKEIFDLREKLLRYSSRSNKKQSVLSAKFTFDDILYESAAMQLVVEQCRQVARTDSAVMIYGETGTGKELFAQSIHNASGRAGGPFIAINCAALPENLLESILFGSVRGAYTGAENKKGLFEQADHGTLLLDEINSMNISLQAKLLRVLQEGTVRRVGGSEEIPVDVRVLSNINVPPYEAIANNQLRQDLFYRLGVVNINIPPLRERAGDIPRMIAHFISENNRKLGRNVRGFDQETMKIFRSYKWPGNVRELQHAVEHAMIILPDSAEEITKEYIPHQLLYADEMIPAAGAEHSGRVMGAPEREQSQSPGKQTTDSSGNDLNRQLQNMEEDMVLNALKESGGNITRAARALKMSRQNLQYRIRRYGIDPGQFRQ